jgi:hypothetical protein
MNIVKAAYPPPDVYFKRKVALISGTTSPGRRRSPWRLKHRALELEADLASRPPIARYHWPGRLLPRRALAREGLPGPRVRLLLARSCPFGPPASCSVAFSIWRGLTPRSKPSSLTPLPRAPFPFPLPSGWQYHPPVVVVQHRPAAPPLRPEEPQASLRRPDVRLLFGLARAGTCSVPRRPSLQRPDCPFATTERLALQLSLAATRPTSFISSRRSSCVSVAVPAVPQRRS